MFKPKSALPNDYSAQDAQSKIFDEIMQYAHGKKAHGIKQKYAPKAPPKPISPPSPDTNADPELDEASLEKLAALARG